MSIGISQSAKYYIIIAGECTVNLPQFDNVTYIKTENRNYDFGGYCFFFKQFDFKSIKSNDIFIFLNSSVRGPFIAGYYNNNWYKIFSTKLIGDTKLVGGSINILPGGIDRAKLVEKSFRVKAPFPHVQTTVYAMTYEALSYLMSIGFYDIDYEIERAEVILL
ncbi:MAG: hypothetical protein F3745_04325 [Nitrospinae bacterium]|nr:hypothetical protein [Nitrospinota bacterium]